MKCKRWSRGLGKRLVKQIREIKPEKVELEVFAPSYVTAEIIDENGYGGFGVAICSTSDRSVFSVKKGKTKAAGRALKALARHRTSLPIRINPELFPRTWTKKQCDHVLSIGDKFKYKSMFC